MSAKTIEVHVTRVSGNDVFGHTTDHCDEQGCNGDELYFSQLDGGTGEYSAGDVAEYEEEVLTQAVAAPR